MSKLSLSFAVGTGLQIAMVLIGHLAPAAQQDGLFPIVGTLIGGITGWLAAPAATTGSAIGRGAAVACLAGIIGSLVSTTLGDVPVSNAAIAGAATLVAGAIGALIRQKAARSGSQSV
jgi:uncharacterized membrane protein YeaQ/YmgE (transglycosylase-associated protein family)